MDDPSHGKGICMMSKKETATSTLESYTMDTFSKEKRGEGQSEFTRLNYTLCFGPTIVSVHDHHLPKKFWSGISDSDMETVRYLLRNPIWQFPANEVMTEEKLLHYGTGPDKRGFVMLDHRWQGKLGDLFFDDERFSRARNVLAQMLRRNVRLVLEI